ncbi:MAG: PEP-CTERM sorting domain-containing protein [Azonexus sp.]|nr:PEP-CTERM sorting domain-containing protein [Azonexus sp.]
MGNIKKVILAAVVALNASIVNADSFIYSYTFFNGPVLSGSFEGTAQNNLVTNLSNITASSNGSPFVGSGNLYGWRHDPTNIHSTLVLGGAVASFDGTQNNFLFMNSDNVDDVFCCTTGKLLPYVGSYSVGGSTWFDQRESGSYYTSTNLLNGQSLSLWSLRQVIAVPEPETYAMFLAGLGLMGGIARRRKQK